MIALPEAIADLDLVVSMSGGKDSVAVALLLVEAGLPHRRVFADTGWEAPETYAHLDLLRERLGPIDVVGAPGGMVAKIRHRAGFPARMQRWCTRELKLRPLRAYHDALEVEGRETCSVVGVRGAESPTRARMLPVEDDETWGGWMWRPILAWSVEDVLAIHHRHGVPVNPLYQRGHSRVGCFPCIYANKEEIRLIAEHAPDRIAEIRDLEAESVKLRAERNAEKPGRYTHPVGSFFQSREPSAARFSVMPIDEAVSWSRTSHGGRQLPMFEAEASGGCFRWGMCDPPVKE